MNSVLGLIGFSVVEAERAPVHSHIYRNAKTQGNANLGQVGAVGDSRLDRLPRPGQRGPRMTLPSNSFSQFDPTFGQASNGYPEPYATQTNPTALSPSNGVESTFSKWMNSRDPLFGQQPNVAGYPSPHSNVYQGSIATLAPGFAGPYPMGQIMPQIMAPVPGPSLAMNDSSWHGINAASQSNGPTTRNAALDYSNQEEEDGFDEFRTPEIQSALVELTQEVASPTESWNLIPLRNQAAAWIESGPTAMVRGEARLLMERVERFESLRQRTLGMVQDPSLIAQQTIRDQAQRLTSTAAQGAGVITASAVQSIGQPGMSSNGQNAQTEGDASGWLVQVHTSNPGQPEFALTDDAGNVIAYVQSTASLNLRRYLQQPVSIQGIRGYLPGLAAKQITAERVTRVR